MLNVAPANAFLALSLQKLKYFTLICALFRRGDALRRGKKRTFLYPKKTGLIKTMESFYKPKSC